MARVPASTYRWQVRESADLFEAARRVPYLHDLGADWIYLSPVLEAEPGSDHGYDLVSHARVDPARGGAEGLAAVSEAARQHGMGVLVDIVPNHMGVATPPVNAWWWDLLTHGRGSRYADAFDVDWDAGGGRLVVPVLGDGGLDDVRVDVEAGVVRYVDNTYPLAPGTSTLAEQHYELVHWTVADDGLNYRRFFAVNTLAAVRVEVPWVFDESHAEIRRWFAEGLVDGLRVDHPDGLLDPQDYLDDLARLTGGAYVLVEKILEPGETLPPSWATAGTTGYDALALVDRVLVDPAGVDRLPGRDTVWATLVHDRKRDVADRMLRSEVKRVVRELSATGGVDTSGPLEDAVAELLACFPTYRSYLSPGRDAADEGRAHLAEAFEAARTLRPDLGATFDALEPMLTDATQPAARRFQQTSGAVMAKGVEDCSFYRYNRLTSLNEVGADPSHRAVSVPEWHAAMAARQGRTPHAMTTLSTHDTKRSEDVRARISVLAEVPAAWAAAYARLQELAPVPDDELALLVWQAVLGAWGSSDDEVLRTRLHGYVEKAMREAGEHTFWTAPHEEFEAGVHAAVDAVLDRDDVRAVMDDLAATVVAAGWSNSLAAKLVQLTMPGVPDVYQGSELWEQSLVDPDNRRAVDLDLRARMLADLDAGLGTTPLSADVDLEADAKLWLVTTALRLRRERPELFTSYQAVGATGGAAGHVLAFDRGGAVTVATRLPVGLAARGGWGDTRLDLPAGTWRDALSGRVVEARDCFLDDLLHEHPVALLVREDA
ncbi:MAG: malto-oligosyltrehalose synthase [Nocardioides sp.]|nr:malto-oligosyltrehalose synthase [Nocardioides sp.]